MPTNLATNYLGLKLASPVIIGACPLTIKPEFVRQVTIGGAGAVVLPSLFQEQIEDFEHIVRNHADGGSHSDKDAYNGGPKRYLNSINEIKAGKMIPVIASLNGSANGDWLKFSKKLESAGADAVELHFQSIPSDMHQTAEQIESELCAMLAVVRSELTIPVSIKLSQHFTNISALVGRMKNCGANGVVLFSHLPTWDVCIDSRQWITRWELTPRDSIGATLEGIVRVRSRNIDISIAASGGVATSEDAIKAFVAGADTVMVTSEIYRSGADSIRTIVDGIANYLDAQPFGSFADFQRSLLVKDIQPTHDIREEFLKPLIETNHYPDPTPLQARRAGDRFGHVS